MFRLYFRSIPFNDLLSWSFSLLPAGAATAKRAEESKVQSIKVEESFMVND
jgi:hypothetical protein